MAMKTRQRAARRSQCYWLNFERGIPKKKLWRFLRWIIHSFAAPCTYIIYLQPPQQLLHLCFMQQNRPYDQLPQRVVNTQPHFTLFHYNSLISLCGITVLQHDHTFIHCDSVASCTQENQFLIRTLSFFLNMERNVFD